MTARGQQLSGERVHGNQIMAAERKAQAHQTLHLPPHFRGCAWNSERKSDQNPKGDNSCTCILFDIGTQSRQWHKNLQKALKENKTNGKDLESWRQDERHGMLVAWVRRTRVKENCKATSVHNKWWDSSGMTANSCLVSSALTAAASAGLSLPPAPLTPSPTEVMIKVLLCGSEAFLKGKVFQCCWSRRGQCQAGTTLTKGR